MAKSPIPLTQEYLKSILHYDPLTGEFRWKHRPREHFATERAWNIWNAKCADKEAGSLKDGYLRIYFDGRRHYAHRLAWLYMKGKWPENDIDHWDLDPGNNRWSNLREASDSQNAMNRPKGSRNTSGFKGVSWHKVKGCWQAQIKLRGKVTYLGLFDAPEAAHAAYCEAAQKHFGEFARLN